MINPGARVRMTAAGAAEFPDLAARHGTVLRVDGWPVVAWDEHAGECRLPAEWLEEVA